MVFVTGGAHQGKLDFVKNELLCNKAAIQYYRVDQENNTPENIQDKALLTEGVVVVSSIEKSLLSGESLKEVQSYFDKLIELDARNQIELILVGEQIGSGIVPMEKQDRIWRDEVGFLYQHLTEKSSEVYRIWAGLSEKLKG